MKSKKIIMCLILIISVVGISGCTNFNNNLSQPSVTEEEQAEFQLKSDIIAMKNEAISSLNAATNLYTDISMDKEKSEKYLITSNNATHKAFCITTDGLIANNYLRKNNSKGVFLIEFSFQDGTYSYIVWIHNNKLGIPGYEKNQIRDLTLDENNTNVNNNYSSGNGLITKFDGINSLLDSVSKGSITLTSPSEHGGTGETYTNITCINDKMN